MSFQAKHITACALAALLSLCLAACSHSAGGEATVSGGQSGQEAVQVGEAGFANVDLGNGWKAQESMSLEYATQFAVDSFEGGYRFLRLANGERFLVVPEGADVPVGIDGDIVVLQQPLNDIYLVASDTGCLFSICIRWNDVSGQR